MAAGGTCLGCWLWCAANPVRRHTSQLDCFLPGPASPPTQQGLFGCLPWGMILTYLNDYLSQNKGLRIQTATLVR